MMEPFFFCWKWFCFSQMWHTLFSTSVHLVCSVKIILIGLEKISFHFASNIFPTPKSKKQFPGMNAKLSNYFSFQLVKQTEINPFKRSHKEHFLHQHQMIIHHTKLFPGI